MKTQVNSSLGDADARPIPVALEPATGGDVLPAPGQEMASAGEKDGEPDWLLVLLRALGVWTV
jgi:hypothetical protein